MTNRDIIDIVPRPLPRRALDWHLHRDGHADGAPRPGLRWWHLALGTAIVAAVIMLATAFALERGLRVGIGT